MFTSSENVRVLLLPSRLTFLFKLCSLPHRSNTCSTCHCRSRPEKQLQMLTSSVGLNPHQIDAWSCVWGDFSAKKYYNFCFWDVQVDPEFKLIWKSKCTMKIKVFPWLLMADRLNPRDMLRGRHYNIGTDLKCLLCGAAREIAERLFFDCQFSACCWDKLQVSWPSGGDRLQKLHAGRVAWSGTLFTECFATTAWNIWKERNNKNFRGIHPTLSGSWF